MGSNTQWWRSRLVREREGEGEVGKGRNNDKGRKE